MVRIENKEHFNEALKIAKKLGGKSRKSFQHCIHMLNRIKRNGCKGYTLIIAPDWVTHSFTFGFLKFDEDGQIIDRRMYGGLILHGFEETLSIELCPDSFPHWSIHT